MILVDTNVVIDLFDADRVPHHTPATHLFGYLLDHEIRSAVAAHTLTTVESLLTRSSDRALAQRAVDWLLAHTEIATVDRGVLIRARALGWRDFEDAVVAAAAEAHGCQLIVTRNASDFEDEPVPVTTPLVYLASR